MSNISAALSAYTPPVSAPVAAPDPTANVPAQGDATANTNADANNNNPLLAAAATTPTNANDFTPATYTALANASASNIRGINVNASV